MRRLLPLFIDLGSRIVVILGGGSVGERKARLFRDYCRVIVVSKTFTEGLLKMEEDGSVELIRADLSRGRDNYLKGAFIIIPATDNAALNRAIELEASAKGILVNNVDGAGEVIVPSIINKGPIAIAISTESPALSKYIRMRLESELGEDFEGMATLLGQIRRELKKRVPDQKERSRIIWSILSDDEVWRLLDESYEKAYMRAREQVERDERDFIDAGDPSESVH